MEMLKHNVIHNNNSVMQAIVTQVNQSHCCAPRSTSYPANHTVQVGQRLSLCILHIASYCIEWA